MMRAGHRQSGGVGGGSSGVVCENHHVGSEFSERMRTNTLFECPLGKPLEDKLPKESGRTLGVLLMLGRKNSKCEGNNTCCTYLASRVFFCFASFVWVSMTSFFPVFSDRLKKNKLSSRAWDSFLRPRFFFFLIQQWVYPRSYF